MLQFREFRIDKLIIFLDKSTNSSAESNCDKSIHQYEEEISADSNEMVQS